MQKTNYLLIMLITFFLTSIPVNAEQGNEQDWRSSAKDINLSEIAIEKLAANNVVITEESYKQIFTPYLKEGRKLPFFITTDSLINAYHVLYEESVLRLENANANRLEEILKFVLTNLSKTDEDINYRSDLVQAARERAFIVVGTALKLLDENYKISYNVIDKIANEEVEKIKLAAAKEKPSWLGKPTDDLIEIDYSRYKPRSFYTSSEKLSKYFRAVSWLQSIPFRLDKDDELLSILMLGNCLNSNQFGSDSEKFQKYKDFFSTFKLLIGSGDDWDVITAMIHVDGKLSENNLSNIREKLALKLKEEGGSQINDQVRFPPSDPNAAAEPQFRFISAYRTPDSVMFHRTTDIRKFSRSFPDGLEVCAALGSEFAKNKLTYFDKTKLLKTIEDTKGAFSGDSLYLDYLQCLACLLDEPSAQSPAFMKNEAWQAKSCNATLAGWSQLRHTWSLQAKQSVTYSSLMTGMPEGFVEPETDFYKKMASLAGKSRDILEKAGAFETDYSELSDIIMEYILHTKNNTNSENESESFSQNQEAKMNFIHELMYSSGNYSFLESPEEAIEGLQQIADDLRKNKLPENERTVNYIKKQYFDLNNLWKELESLSGNLAEISEKQLKEEELKEYERIIAGYGLKLAKIMLYGGNSYINPNDNAMRIVDVHSAPGTGYLEVGIGRARVIYVLYPWQGKLILCKGAVMPYYEFISDSRLTDNEWKMRLDSGSQTDVPGWIKPVMAENN